MTASEMGGYLSKIFVFAMGAVIGSFLNVCIYRMPKSKSIIYPPSHCPKCDKAIRWYDNIPVLSYALLLGRCRYCRKTIFFRYPLVEMLTAVLILLSFSTFGLSVKFFIYSAFICALIVATFIDIDINEIPDIISVGGLAAGLVSAAAFPVLFDTTLRGISFLGSVKGAMVGGLAIYAMRACGNIAFRKKVRELGLGESMGLGDVKLMAMIGAIMGWKLVLLVFFTAPIFGALAGIVMKIRDGQEILPYGPYLSLAAVISLFYGNRVLDLFFYQ